MAYYAAILDMLDSEKNKELRPQHLDYLKKHIDAGHVFKCGPFTDGSGGMVIYIADSYDEAKELAEGDPYVSENVRSLDLREWKI